MNRRSIARRCEAIFPTSSRKSLALRQRYGSGVAFRSSTCRHPVEVPAQRSDGLRESPLYSSDAVAAGNVGANHGGSGRIPSSFRCNGRQADRVSAYASRQRGPTGRWYLGSAPVAHSKALEHQRPVARGATPGEFNPSYAEWSGVDDRYLEGWSDASAHGEAAAAFILRLATNGTCSSWLKARFLLWSGHNSYSLYLMHMGVAIAVHEAIAESHLNVGSVALWVATIAKVVATFVVAAGPTKFVENPCTLVGRRMRWTEVGSPRTGGHTRKTYSPVS
jgi:hypothetical protein